MADERADLSMPAFALLGVALAAAAAALRFAYAHFGHFTDGDEAAIALGVAHQVLTGEAWGHRYMDTAGYYRLCVALLKLVCGGDPARAPSVLVALSALAGTAQVILALALFPEWLTRRARLWLGLALLVNPLLWHSSSFGNTNLVAATALLGAFAAAGSLRGARGAIAAGLLFTCALTLRRDVGLALPGLAICLRARAGGTWRHAASTLLFLALALLLVGAPGDGTFRGLIRANTAFNEVYEAQFWTYFFWSFGPWPLLLAAIGLGAAWRTRGLRGTLLGWAGPAALYLSIWCTTPRYFVLFAPAIGVLIALGAERVIAPLRAARSRWRWPATALAAGAIVGPAFLVPERFTPGLFDTWTYPFTYETHSGPYPYGALLMTRRADLPPPWQIPTENAFRVLARDVAASDEREETWVLAIDRDMWFVKNALGFYLTVERGARARREGVALGALPKRLELRPIDGSAWPSGVPGANEDEALAWLKQAARRYRISDGAPEADPFLARLRAKSDGALHGTPTAAACLVTFDFGER